MSDESADADDAEAQARSRALSSPTRLRILRLCAFEARTNKELAGLLDLNPGTTLHHVRTLVATGFLEAQDERAGAQGAREVPYKATGRSWGTHVPGISPLLVETFLQQIEGVPADALNITWLGLKLNAASRAELEERLYRLAQEFKERGPDADGDTYSLFTVLHPDLNPPAT